jgi:hypothetical protein
MITHLILFPWLVTVTYLDRVGSLWVFCLAGRGFSGVINVHNLYLFSNLLCIISTESTITIIIIYVYPQEKINHYHLSQKIFAWVFHLGFTVIIITFQQVDKATSPFMASVFDLSPL